MNNNRFIIILLGMAASLFTICSPQAEETPPPPLDIPLNACSKKSNALFLDPRSFITSIDTINQNAQITANFVNCDTKDYKIIEASLRIPPVASLTNKEASVVSLVITDNLIPKQEPKTINLSAPSVKFLLNQCDLAEVEFKLEYTDTTKNPDKVQTELSLVFIVKKDVNDVCPVKDPDAVTQPTS